jgi:Tol biopolymer transport system component
VQRQTNFSRVFAALLLLLQACGGGGDGGGDVSTPAAPAPPAGGAQRIDRAEFLAASRNGATIAYTGVANGSLNVYLYTLATGAKTLVSVDSSGTTAGNDDSYLVQLSGDGAHVVFASRARNLVPGIIYSAPPGGRPHVQIFARELATGRTRLVSIDPSGFAAGNAEAADRFAVSGNGRYVAFASKATNLVPGFAYTGGYNVFVRDLVDEQTELVSVGADGMAAGCCGDATDSYFPAISDDGRYVAFVSAATNLVTGVTYTPVLGGGIGNIFLRDRDAGSTRLLSASPDGTQAANASCTVQTSNSSPTSYMARDGSIVVFSCTATNLVTGVAYPTNFTGVQDFNLFAWHRASPSLMLVSRSFDGNAAANDYAGNAVVSADGRYVAFEGRASNLVAGVVYLTAGPGGIPISNVFRWDRQTATVQLVTRSRDGKTGADFNTLFPEISDDGQVVAFTGSATNLSSTPVIMTFNEVQANAAFWNAATNVVALASVDASGTPMGWSGPVVAVSGTGNFIAFLRIASPFPGPSFDRSAYFFRR